MKKRFLLVAALCAAMNMTSFADETNLAQGKDVKASSEQQAATNAVDGNLGSRWEVKTSEEHQNGGVVEDGSYWLYVDLGEAKTFNTLRIKWEGGYAKTFKVLVADELDATTEEPKWKDEAILTKTEALTDFSKYYAYFLDNAVTARYVKLQAEELGFAPYFSVFELGIYNLTEAEKTPTITTMTTPNSMVAPGDEFSVNVEDQFGNAMSDVTYTCVNAENLGNGKFKALADGEITITAKDSQGNEKTIKLTAYVPTLTTVKVSPAFVVTGQETPLTFTVLDQQGKAIDGYTTSLTDNKLTATEDGEQEIIVTYKGVEKKVNVYAVSKGVDAPTLGVDDMPIFIDGTEGYGTADAGWNEHYDKQQVIDLDGNKVLSVSNVGTFGIKKGSITDTDYTTLNFDIFSTTDVKDAYVKYEGAGADFENLKFSLEAGKWNHISLEVDGANAYNDWIQIYLGKNGATTNPDILLDNVYLAKASASQDMVIGNADDNGFVSVKGEITTDDLATLEETDGTAFDLTKAKLGEGVTFVVFKNPNAIIQVAGTVDGTTATAATSWGDTKNVVVKRNDGYYFPIAQMEIADQNPVYRTFFISTNTIGFKYTRQLAAKTYATVYMPSAVATLPEGVKAYEFTTDETDANKVALKEVQTLNAKVPYIVYNGNETEITLESAGTGDMDFRKAVADDKTTAVGNLNVIGTFDYFAGADKAETIYGIQNETGNNGEISLKKIGAAAIVCPFRLYFTVNGSQAAKDIKFTFEGETTGISGFNGAEAAKMGNVYSLDGRLVKANATSTVGLKKGVYVLNGKKYVVK